MVDGLVLVLVGVYFGGSFPAGKLAVLFKPPLLFIKKTLSPQIKKTFFVNSISRTNEQHIIYV